MLTQRSTELDRQLDTHEQANACSFLIEEVGV